MPSIEVALLHGCTSIPEHEVISHIPSTTHLSDHQRTPSNSVPVKVPVEVVCPKAAEERIRKSKPIRATTVACFTGSTSIL